MNTQEKVFTQLRNMRAYCVLIDVLTKQLNVSRSKVEKAFDSAILHGVTLTENPVQAFRNIINFTFNYCEVEPKLEKVENCFWKEFIEETRQKANYVV